MMLISNEILFEIVNLIGNKLQRFYLKYWKDLNADMYAMISLLYEILEVNPEFNQDADINKTNRDVLQKKLFDELNSSKEFGIRKSLFRIQKKYNLSLEEMKYFVTNVVLLSYQEKSYPMMEAKRGMSN